MKKLLPLALVFLGITHAAIASDKFDGTYDLDYTFTSSVFNGFTVPMNVKSKVKFDIRNGKVANIRGDNLTPSTGTSTKAKGTGGVKNGKLDITLTFDQTSPSANLKWSITFLGAVKVSGSTAKGVGSVSAVGGGNASGVAVAFTYAGNYLIKKYKEASGGSTAGGGGSGGGLKPTPQALSIHVVGGTGGRQSIREGKKFSMRIDGYGNPTQLRYSGEIPPGLLLNSFGTKKGAETIFILRGTVPKLRFPQKNRYVAIFQAVKTTGKGGRSNKLKVVFTVK
jgi:hypothetical protein